jgi:hypothetical protein
MNQYITVKGVYDKGNVRLLEVPDTDLVSNTEVMVMIPMRKSRVHKKFIGIPIAEFSKKINLFSIGGDSVKETEELYND